MYRGDLLEGFYDDWVLLERERQRETYQQALERLVQLNKSTRRYPNALEAALKLTIADPLRESAQREVMRLFFALQRPEAALKQFAACRQILNAELALEPEIKTVALAHEVTQRSGVSPAPYLSATLLPMPLALDDARSAQIPPSQARTNTRNETAVITTSVWFITTAAISSRRGAPWSKCAN